MRSDASPWTDGDARLAAAAAAEALPPHPPLQRWYSSEREHRQRVGGWFDQAAGSYDWISQAMSLGSGNWYRREALLRAGLRAGMRVLDLGCGTGVLAAEAQVLAGASGLVAGLDPSLGMLRQAAGRGVRRRLRGVADDLPFGAASFDLLSMGYALRHVGDLRTTFAELRRVLRGGGKLLLLEITPPANRFAFGLVKLYLARIVPRLAALHGGAPARDLMRYYWETIERCVPPAVILGALADAGFADPRRRVEMGILSEYTAVA
jgi:demethylmenaquinone methyltransferase/2-methoxy-6-polyprenyl-1,4-benzoquinol methylase